MHGNNPNSNSKKENAASPSILLKKILYLSQVVISCPVVSDSDRPFFSQKKKILRLPVANYSPSHAVHQIAASDAGGCGTPAAVAVVAIIWPEKVVDSDLRRLGNRKFPAAVRTADDVG